LAWIVLTLSAQGYAKSDIETEKKALTMCVSHYPPYQVVLANQAPIGENIAVTTSFVNQLGFAIRFTKNNSFWRCLAMLKAGKVDLMSGLLDAPERRDFAHLFAYSTLNDKKFYVNRKDLNISTFSDLKGLRVAVLRGVKQFKEFDDAPEEYLKKVYVTDLDAAFRVLAAGKVDVVMSTDYLELENFKNQVQNTLEIKEFTLDLGNSSLLFTALSKKSKVAHLAPKFAELSKKLNKKGEFRKIINTFKKEYPQYYR